MDYIRNLIHDLLASWAHFRYILVFIAWVLIGFVASIALMGLFALAHLLT